MTTEKHLLTSAKFVWHRNKQSKADVVITIDLFRRREKIYKKLTRELNEEKVHEKCLRQCVEIDFLEQQ